MTEEEKNVGLDWVRRVDLTWIEDNAPLFQTAAWRGFQRAGRGAVVVDLASTAGADGHPYAYWSQAQLEESAWCEVNRLVQAYDPQEEMVIMLLKPEGRISVHKIDAQLGRHAQDK